VSRESEKQRGEDKERETVREMHIYIYIYEKKREEESSFFPAENREVERDERTYPMKKHHQKR
jgi:hypothetical protein